MKSGPNFVYTRRRTKTEGGCMSLILALCGVALMLTFNCVGLAFGLLFFAIATMVQKSHCYCGICGNDVANTSKQCPSCRAIFGRSPKMEKQHRLNMERAFYAFGFGLMTLVLVVLYWLSEIKAGRM
jgi:predicted nucleic acid-binding Zn ribbon protein